MHQQVQNISIQEPNKLLGLEVMRFIAALSVLLWHYQHFSYIADKPTNFTREDLPFYSFLRLFYNYGNSGVQVFWCISGFVFFLRYKTAIAEGAVSAGNFFKFRFSRLYPLHLVTLLFVAIMQKIYFSKEKYFFVYQTNDFVHFILQLFLASYWGFQKGTSFNGPSWSISVEVLVYFIFFLFLRYIGKSFLLNAMILLFCLALRLIEPPSQVIDCLTFFYAGGLASMVFLYFEETKYKKLLGKVALYFFGMSMVVLYNTELYKNAYFPSVFFLVYTPVLIIICAKHMTMPPKLQKAIETAGNMTYASYLIQFPVQISIAVYFLNIERPIPYYNDLFFGAFLSIVFIAAYFIYYFFEHPAQILIRKIN